MPRVEAGTKAISRSRRKSEPLFGTRLPLNDEPPEWKKYAQERARRGEECPVCLGLRYTRYDVPISDERFGKMFDCPACSAGRVSQYLREHSGVKVDWMRHAKMEDWFHTKGREPQYDAMMELLRKGSGWLTIWGEYGTGKTYLMACAINEFIQKKRQGVYVEAGALLDHLRDSYKDESYRYAFGQWSSCFALALDEVNEYHATPWAADKYRQLLNHRYNMKDESVTILACNVDPSGKSWPEGLGWLYSRMTEFPIVEAGGGDVRPLLKREEF